MKEASSGGSQASHATFHPAMRHRRRYVAGLVCDRQRLLAPAEGLRHSGLMAWVCFAHNGVHFDPHAVLLVLFLGSPPLCALSSCVSLLAHSAVFSLDRNVCYTMNHPGRGRRRRGGGKGAQFVGRLQDQEYINIG